jgi:hypothetical protein
MTLANPKTVEALLETPPAPGWQREWREKIAEAVKTPQPVTREKEALTAMASLSLATWAARVF